MPRLPLLALALMSLASCGGDSGSDDPQPTVQAYQAAVNQAASKQAEAVALAPASPCDSARQCGNLTFSQPQGNCAVFSYHTYSLVSPTAEAASAAAAEQRSLADHATTIAPPPYTSCVTSAGAQPTPVCVANACQAAPLQ